MKTPKPKTTVRIKSKDSSKTVARKVRKAIQKPKLLPVTVDRKKWYRGRGDGSLLVLGNGKMCCLGFVGKACGLRKKDILSVATPGDMPAEKKLVWPPGMFTETARFGLLCSKDTGCAMDLNDDVGLTAKEREKKLKALGPKIGVKFTFVG